MADEKLKILYLMRILMEETDKEHVLSANELAARMDITCNRKTVYTDIEKLREFGLNIVKATGSNPGYYIAEREFELPELKLLVDAVQSSKFITTKKSEKLIKKLEKLTSHENARQLQRQVYIYNRAKADNETIYANVDALHTAIYLNRHICFKYCEWTVGKKLVRRKNCGSSASCQSRKFHPSCWKLTPTLVLLAGIPFSFRKASSRVLAVFFRALIC